MIYVSVRFVMFIVGHPYQTSNDDLTWCSWTDGKTMSNRHLFVDCGPYCMWEFDNCFSRSMFDEDFRNHRHDANHVLAQDMFFTFSQISPRRRTTLQ